MVSRHGGVPDHRGWEGETAQGHRRGLLENRSRLLARAANRSTEGEDRLLQIESRGDAEDRPGLCPIRANSFSMFFVKLTRTRHPERSASHTYRLREDLQRGVEGPRRRFRTHAARSFSTTEARQQDLLPTHLLPQGNIAACPVRARWLKSSEQLGRVSAAGVLRLRAVSPLLSDRCARRFAQDDESGGRTNGTETFVRGPGALQVPRLRSG